MQSFSERRHRRYETLGRSRVMHLVAPGQVMNRRALLMGGTGLAVAAAFRRSNAAPTSSRNEFSLTAAPGRVLLVGKSRPVTNVLCYGNAVPGPVIRVRQGERLRV